MAIRIWSFLCSIILIFSSCSNEESGKKSQPVVYVAEEDGQYFLIRNGKPFFIKGAAGPGTHLKELKEAGANTLRVYDTIGLEDVLDRAYYYDLAVAVDIPLPSFRTFREYYEKDMTDEIAQIAAFIEMHKDHPALLYWNLGNEIRYPLFYKDTRFFDNYNLLLKTIKLADPNHPVSTSIAGSNKMRLNSIYMRSPEIDFISMNIFGGLTDLEENLVSLMLIWDGPYVISEWGINGPWEEGEIAWRAPIEPTGTKKAEIIGERYLSEALQNPRCIGNIVFYWGTKQESTKTWFSIFTETGEKTPAFYKLRSLWKEEPYQFPGPKIAYALMGKKGAPEGIILEPGQRETVKIFYHEPLGDSLVAHWKITKEAWADRLKETKSLPHLFLDKKIHMAEFVAPEEEGPYRISYQISDLKGNANTVNIPFYVLSPKHAE